MASEHNIFAKTFEPIPGLRRENASTILLFLVNYMQYAAEVKDPWFGPTEAFASQGLSGSVNYTAYFPKYANGVLGCFEYDEMCNPMSTSSSCAPVNMYGASVSGNLTSLLGFNAKQQSTAERLTIALQRSVFSTAVRELNGGSMLATARSYAWGANPVPDNQWTLELQNWFSTILVTTQVAIRYGDSWLVNVQYPYLTLTTIYRQYVTGYQNTDYNKWVVQPSAQDAWMCHAQITQSSDYASFNVFGLAMILVIGGLIMVLNITLASMVDWIRLQQKSNSLGHLRTAQWKELELLRLHERACVGDNQSSSLSDVPLHSLPVHKSDASRHRTIVSYSVASDSDQSKLLDRNSLHTEQSHEHLT